MLLAHQIRLTPTPEQETYFLRACGVARFSYNWALCEWQKERDVGKTVSEAALRKRLNAIKRAQYPWMLDVTKNAPQQAIKNLGRACANYLDDLKQYKQGNLNWRRIRKPAFKKKGSHDSFRADGGTSRGRPDAVRIHGHWLNLPVIGSVRMREGVRFAGAIRSVTITRKADHWYASVCIDVPYQADAHRGGNVIGVDLGVSVFATISDGPHKITAPKPYARRVNQLKRMNRNLARKQASSKNRAKAKAKLARLHLRIGNIRGDFLHKLTTKLTRYQTIIIEDLNVRGMLANRHLSQAISDTGFFEFRRQLEYKTRMAGSTLVIASRWFASSKLCSVCRVKNEQLKLQDRVWTCTSCGTVHDRDVNAARNLARYPESWAGAACGAGGSGGETKIPAQPSAAKQEENGGEVPA